MESVEASHPFCKLLQYVQSLCQGQGVKDGTFYISLVFTISDRPDILFRQFSYYPVWLWIAGYPAKSIPGTSLLYVQCNNIYTMSNVDNIYVKEVVSAAQLGRDIAALIA